MTDQPPPERPGFDPPSGAPDASQPSDYGPPAGSQGYPPPGMPGAQPSDYGPPAGSQGYPPPPPFPPQQPWREAPRSGGRGSIVLGLVIAVVALGLSTFAALSGSSNLIASLSFYVPIILLVGGIVLAAIPRTTRTGAGILIGIGASILIVGGLCIALLAGLYR